MLDLFRARDGSTAVEFAIAVPVFLALLFGTVEFGRYFWARNTIQYAAEEGARYAMVSGATDAQITARVQDRASPLNTGGLTIGVQRETVGGVTYVVIDTRYNWASAAFTGFFPASLRVASGRARVPLLN
ncbi:TadE/TadG family type IV pilus assembly protein [Azospirillum sp. sgz302134]